MNPVGLYAIFFSKEDSACLSIYFCEVPNDWRAVFSSYNILKSVFDNVTLEVEELWAKSNPYFRIQPCPSCEELDVMWGPPIYKYEGAGVVREWEFKV